MLEKNQKLSAADYSPVLTFVISFFIFQLFDWQDATHFVLATFISLATFMIELHLLKEEKNLTRKSIRQTNFYSGLLTLFFLFVFASGFLHWFRLIPISWRTAILLFLVIAYLVVLFRAIRTLHFVKITSENKK